MIQFQSLKALDHHQQFLQKRMKNPNLFLVGGCIRDLLLWITKTPLDIDFTMRGKPAELYENFDKTGLSHFITEKFGTATFITPTTPLLKGGRSAATGGSNTTKNKKLLNEPPLPWQNPLSPPSPQLMRGAVQKGVHYELTPLRTEGNYEDFRHPWEIQRSNSLILDSQRRDFTINAMYYFSVKKQSKAKLDFVKEGKTLDEKSLVKVLEQEGYCYLTNLNLLILRDQGFIDQIFHEAVFDEDYFRYLIETQKEGRVWGTTPPSRQQSGEGVINKFRILIDPTGWLTSLVNKRLETVGEADKRFGEDALRVMRALRIVNVCNWALHTPLRKGGSDGGAGGVVSKKSSKKSPLPPFTKGGMEILFDFTTDTWESIKRNAHLIQHVAKERIKEELCKVFIKGDPFWFIVLLKVSGILPLLFPALHATIHNDQPVRYHAFDTYSHTILTLQALQNINPDYLTRFATLYHDVGKVGQYQAYEQAKNREEIRSVVAGPLNHRASSPELMKQDFRALGFSNKEIETIAWYIAEHHTPGEILTAHPEHREKKIRKLLSEKGYDMVNNLLDINIADRLWQGNPLQNSADLRDSYELKTILKRLNQEEGQFKISDLAVKGTLLMQALGIAAGPLVGELLEQAFDRVLTDIPGRNTEKEILTYLKNYLKNRK